jgi:ribosomal protein S13
LGTKKGTTTGEFVRNVTQFKSSIVETILRHVMRAMRQDTTANKIKYAAEYTVLTTLIGGMIYELKEILNGKTPVNPIEHPAEYLGESLRKGGTLPIVSDTFLPYLINPTDFEKSKSVGDLALGFVTPPTLTQVLGIGVDSVQSIIEAAGGDEEKAQKELSRAVTSTLKLVPGSNMWYAKEMYNEYVIDSVKKILDPNGYAKSQRREKKEMEKLDQDFLF